MRVARSSTLIIAALAAASLASSSPLRGMLPLVGTVESLDVGQRRFGLRGPDGGLRSLEVPEGATLLKDRGVDLALADLAKGRTVGVILRSLEAVQLVILIDPPSTELKAWLREVVAEDKSLRFQSLDGDTLTLRPAVNLGAVAAEGAVPQSANWEWFEKRIGQAFAVRTVQVLGMTCIWSIGPWKPKEEEKPPGESGQGR